MINDERVLAMLRDIRRGIVEIYRHIDRDRDSKAMKACRSICDAIDAIIADADPETRYHDARTALARAEQDNARLRAVLAWAADEIMALHSALGELRGCIVGRA